MRLVLKFLPLSLIRTAIISGLVVTHSAGKSASPESVTRPDMSEPYLDLAATYAVYAKKSLWHEAEAGGYWGVVGIGEKNTNGAVRGMANTMLGYAVLARGWSEGWLPPAAREELSSAGLDRNGLLKHVRANLEHIIAHHVAQPNPRQPVWGDHWQSPLWLSAAGFSVLLLWEDLPPELRSGIMRVARHEADRVAAIPPHDYKPGNTAAEENAWDQLAPALAMALEPDHPNAAAWWKALRAYAVNTYSVPADRTSTATVGTDPVREIVTTANAFDDFTLDNHGFFHPDYVQVSGQHLGEAWLLLALGDRIHGTRQAEKFEPYSLHHVKDVWENVTSRLLLPHGEFAFPSGNDWTYHCSMNQSYLAFIATALQDPLALLAEKRAVRQAQLRRKVSPPGRILGDSNLEWWWEPLLIKRCSTALLHHMLRPAPTITSSTEELLDRGTWTAYFPDSHVWLHRNGHYFVSVSWGKRRMGVIYPFASDPLEKPYMTLPIDDGILPDQVRRLAEMSDTAAVLEMKDGRRCGVVCLPNSVLWVSPVALRPVGIENDTVTGPERTVSATTGSVSVPALVPHPPFPLPGEWLNVDDSFGHISVAGGFSYVPAGGLNRRSAAIDRLVPSGKRGIWQMIPNAGTSETQRLARDFSVTDREGTLAVVLRDGSAGQRYQVRASLERPAGRETGRGEEAQTTDMPPGDVKSVEIQVLE